MTNHKPLPAIELPRDAVFIHSIGIIEPWVNDKPSGVYCVICDYENKRGEDFDVEGDDRKTQRGAINAWNRKVMNEKI